MASVRIEPIKAYDDDGHEFAGPALGMYDLLRDDCIEWLGDLREWDYDEQRRNSTDFAEWCNCIDRDYAGRIIRTTENRRDSA